MSSLKPFNTFGVDVNADELIVIDSKLDLNRFSFKSTTEYFILGGGSNLLLTKDICIPVLKNEIKGFKVLSENADLAIIEIGGGENWHEMVLKTIKSGYGGLENLSLIPGTIGASPIQNIGAYGVEVKDLIYQVNTFDMIQATQRQFSKDECEFAYRDSFFKKDVNRGRFFVTSVVFKLHKDPCAVNISYGIIEKILSEKGIENPTISDVSDAVIEIRSSKLPDPLVLGNSGSFFKNPIVLRELYEAIAVGYKKMPFYEVSKASVKIPAGWLIEQCGWKGKVVGNTGNYKNQSLIIVNYGNASGKEIYEHACNVRDSVFEKFSIKLEFEVNII